jgi:TusA-related sulfurtransferase
MLATHAAPVSGDVRTDPGEVAGVFVEALTARDFLMVRSVLAEDVRLRMLVPGRLMSDEGADAVVSWFSSWFADADPFQVEGSSAEEVEGRAAVMYRLRLHKPDGWYLIEQHLMLDVSAEGRIAAIDLLCSGFRPITAQEREQELVHEYDAGDLGCADGLATQFRQQIQGIPLGHVLVVTTNDPAAKADLPSLARLMGHAVVSIEAAGDGRLLISVERGK